MAKNKRKAAKKASTSMLMLLIIASAILAFVPFRVTLATGTTGALGNCADSKSTCGTLINLAGTHIAIDSLGLFAQTSTLNSLLVGFVGNSTFTPAFQSALGSISFFAMKAQKITVDIDHASNVTAQGLLGPFQNGPAFSAPGGTVQLRIVMLSVTISGYNLPKAGQTTNVYGEYSLTGLNAALIISLDRAFIDLFVDPYSGIGTYLVQADMTVYQGLALLLEAATL